MHELSIATSIYNTVMSEVKKRDLRAVATIGLRIGALTDIVSDALIFGFEVLSKDTLLEKTELRIESIPVRGVCEACKREFEVDEFIFICPNCYSARITTLQGDELDIEYIEGE